MGLYQPRALCAVAPLLLPGLRSEETFRGDFGIPPGPIVGLLVAHPVGGAPQLSKVASIDGVGTRSIHSRFIFIPY